MSCKIGEILIVDKDGKIDNHQIKNMKLYKFELR